MSFKEKEKIRARLIPPVVLHGQGIHIQGTTESTVKMDCKKHLNFGLQNWKISELKT